MKRVLGSRPTNTFWVIILITTLFMQPFSAAVSAESGQDCKDLLMLFARGSGQNTQNEYTNQPFSDDFQSVERESYAFFSQFKSHIDTEYPNIRYKPVTIHDFPGKYSSVGYRAVPVGVPNQIANTANADASWFPGDYRDSVEQGIIETTGYLKDQIKDCPDQSIVVGGYSQGAQVMGESLFRLTEQERAKIVGVGLFGDPKYIGSTGDDLLNPLDKATSFPWRRGTATNNDRGMLDARIPYLPPDIEKRTASWCFARDLVCSGYSAFAGNTTEAHQSYAQNPMTDTVNELMQWAAPKLAEAERKRGGFGSSTTDPYTPTPAQLAKSRDIMFLLNDDSGETVLQTFRYGVDQVLDPILKQYTSTQLGAKAFGEGESGTNYLTRVNNVQALLPYSGYNSLNPGTSLSNFARSINTRYPFGQTQMGGGDYADPHGLAVEKSVFSGGWRPEVEKHLVLITDRAPKENYNYNICNATVRSWLQIPQTDGNRACITELGTDIWPKTQHPEICETVYLSITSTNCTNPLKTPGYFQFNTRTLEDAVKVAQFQNIHVDVVIPYKIVDQYNVNNVPAMMKNLRYLAEATGGKFIYYDQRTQYSGALLSDTLRQIFTHEPKSLIAAYAQAYDNRAAFNTGIATVTTNSPVILDVSQSNSHYEQYKWDINNDGTWDQTTTGPVAEVTFDTPYSGFAKVLGINSDGTSAQTNIVVAATAQADSSIVLPTVPSITGLENADHSITLSWSGEGTGSLMFVDPASHLPVATASMQQHSVTFIPETFYPELQAYVVTNSAISEPVSITIQPYVAPEPEPEPEDSAGDPSPTDNTDSNDTPPSETGNGTSEETEQPLVVESDPTICFKLQQCTGESRPTTTELLGTNIQESTTPVSVVVSAVVSGAVAVAATTAEPDLISDSSPQVAGVAASNSPNNEATAAPSLTSAKQQNTPWLKLLGLLTILLAAIALVVSGTRRYQQSQ